MTDAELIEAFGAFQRGRAFSENTVRRRRLSLGRFAKHMAPASITSATVLDVDGWCDKLKSARTKHAYTSDLATFFTWACRRGLAPSNPMTNFERVRVPKALPKPAPLAAIADAFGRADADVQLMLMLGALAGLRRAEIAGLDMCDVHLDAVPPVLVVREGKGGKDRIVPLHPTLQRMLRGRRSGFLFPARTPRGHAHPDAIGVALAKALSTPERHLTAHSLRHYFGTEAARNSHGNLLLVGALLGHASPATTQGYVAFAADGMAEVVAAITGVAERGDELAARRSRRAV